MEWIKIFESTSSAEKALSENQPRLLVIRGKRICLVKHDGKILAVQNSCTHSGGSLHLGTINYLGEVVCPLHQYQFDLKTGREASQRSADLECFSIRESEDGVFIGL
jgi:3-phenylpropionate/trans-cinnamate dioxygenase ferredoxin subunit